MAHGQRTRTLLECCEAVLFSIIRNSHMASDLSYWQFVRFYRPQLRIVNKEHGG